MSSCFQWTHKPKSIRPELQSTSPEALRPKKARVGAKLVMGEAPGPEFFDDSIKEARRQTPQFYCWWYKSCTSLRTLHYGNYGIVLIMGNAGFIPSTVYYDPVLGSPPIKTLTNYGRRVMGLHCVSKAAIWESHGLPQPSKSQLCSWRNCWSSYCSYFWGSRLTGPRWSKW